VWTFEGDDKDGGEICVVVGRLFASDGVPEFGGHAQGELGPGGRGHNPVH